MRQLLTCRLTPQVKKTNCFDSFKGEKINLRHWKFDHLHEIRRQSIGKWFDFERNSSFGLFFLLFFSDFLCPKKKEFRPFVSRGSLTNSAFSRSVSISWSQIRFWSAASQLFHQRNSFPCCYFSCSHFLVKITGLPYMKCNLYFRKIAKKYFPSC